MKTNNMLIPSLALSFSTLLTACGGGGGSDEAPLNSLRVSPAGVTEIHAGETLAAKADVRVENIPIVGMAWEVWPVDAPFAEAPAPLLTNANCNDWTNSYEASVYDEENMIASASCSALVIVPPDAVESTWRIVGYAQSEEGYTWNDSFSLRIVKTGLEEGLALNLPGVPLTYPTQKLITLAMAPSSMPGARPSDIRYAWKQLAGPTLYYEGTNAAQLAFTPREAGEYVFEASAQSSLNGSEITTVGSVLFDIREPNDEDVVVSAGDPRIASLNDAVALKAQLTLARKLRQPHLNYRWEQLSGPATVYLATPYSQNTSFTAPLPGRYAFRLTADGFVNGYRFTQSADTEIIVLDPGTMLLQ